MNYVLKLCGWYPSKVDGLSGDFVQRQAMAISGYCKTVVLFAQKDPGIKGSKIERVFSNKGALYEYIYYYPKKNWFDKFWSQWYYLRILKIFLPLLLKEHGPPSIVHVNIAWRAAIWALYLGHKYRWPIVITEHSTEYQPEAIENIREKGLFRKIITRSLFRAGRLFIPVSYQLANTVQALYGKLPFVVIPNVVDTSLFFYQPQKQKTTPPRLLHISTMGYQKNIKGIINVLKQLVQAGVDFEMLLVGPVNEQVRNLVATGKALQGRVTFTGSVSYGDVAAMMQTVDGLILFSRYENLPCVILEALCCGVPVITTGVGGIPEIINKENGVLVAEGDEPALFEAIKNLVEGRLRFDHQMIAYHAEQKFSYETIGASFLHAYELVLQKSSISV